MLHLDEKQLANLEKDLEGIGKKYGLNFQNQDILGKKQQPEEKKEKKENPIHKFKMKPKQLEEYLQEYVIGQKEAIRTFATTICTHYNSIRHLHEKGRSAMDLVDVVKPNVLSIGPTGVGKTYIVKLIAKELGVPFVKADATTFSETGYVGGNVDDMLKDLVKEAEGDLDIAQYGIIYIDEIDKIASPKNMIGKDVSGIGVQRGLLKLMEESEVDIEDKSNPIAQIKKLEEYRKTGKEPKTEKINTKNILFVLSGAFGGLLEIIENRQETKKIGFDSDSKNNNAKKYDANNPLKDFTTEDLKDFGFETEFIGRMPIRTCLDKLTKDNLIEIMNKPTCSIINKKKIDFAAYGIDLEFEQDAIEYFAEEAIKEGTGARSLVTIISNALIDYEAELSDSCVKKFKITKELIDGTTNKVEYANDIASKADIASLEMYLKHFEEAYGIDLIVSKSAKEEIIQKSKKSDSAPYDYCGQRFRILEEVITEMSKFDYLIQDPVHEIELNKELVSNYDLLEEKAMDILYSTSFNAYKAKIEKEQGIKIDFNRDAKKYLIDEANIIGKDLFSYCNSKFGHTVIGMRCLAEQNKSKKCWITKKFAKDPMKYLKSKVQDSE